MCLEGYFLLLFHSYCPSRRFAGRDLKVEMEQGADGGARVCEWDRAVDMICVEGRTSTVDGSRCHRAVRGRMTSSEERALCRTPLDMSCTLFPTGPLLVLFPLPLHLRVSSSCPSNQLLRSTHHVAYAPPFPPGCTVEQEL